MDRARAAWATLRARPAPEDLDEAHEADMRSLRGEQLAADITAEEAEAASLLANGDWDALDSEDIVDADAALAELEEREGVEGEWET